MENVKMLTSEQLKKWRSETDERIKSIRGSANMEIPAGAKVFYVSPDGSDFNDGTSPEKAWQTLDIVNSYNLPAGAYVCIERGGLWRG